MVEEVEEMVALPQQTAVVEVEAVPHHKELQHQQEMFPEGLPAHQPQTYTQLEGQVVSVQSQQTVEVLSMVVVVVPAEVLLIFLVMVDVRYGVVLVVVQGQLRLV
jgi:hypothetical protein